MTIVGSLAQLQESGKTLALKTAMVIYLTHRDQAGTIFEADRNIVIQLVGPLA
jgi:hypothetical protein